MTERLRESLSALMDDEADDLELGRVLRELEGDDELRGTWQRYHLVRAVMRGDHVSGMASRELDVAALEAGLEADSEPLAAGRADGPADRWRAVAGFAAAACVTLALVLTLQPGAEDAAVPELASSAVSGAAVAGAANGVVTASVGGVQRRGGINVRGSVNAGSVNVDSTGSMERRFEGRDGVPQALPVSADPRDRIDAYMLHHAEHSAVNSRIGMMPFTRVAAFDEAP